MIPEEPMFLSVEGLPVKVEWRSCLSFEVPNGRPYSLVEALHRGYKVSPEEWEKLVAEHAN